MNNEIIFLLDCILLHFVFKLFTSLNIIQRTLSIFHVIAGKAQV